MGFFSKFKKELRRFKKKVKKEIKRVPRNIVKYGPQALSFIPGVGPILSQGLSALGLGGGGGGTLQIDPYYPPTGGTPTGPGQLSPPAPGPAFGGRPYVAPLRATQSNKPAMPMIIPLAIGGVLLLTMIRR